MHGTCCGVLTDVAISESRAGRFVRCNRWEVIAKSLSDHNHSARAVDCDVVDFVKIGRSKHGGPDATSCWIELDNNGVFDSLERRSVCNWECSILRKTGEHNVALRVKRDATTYFEFIAAVKHEIVILPAICWRGLRLHHAYEDVCVVECA